MNGCWKTNGLEGDESFSLFGNTYFYLTTGRERTISIWKIPQMMSSLSYV